MKHGSPLSTARRLLVAVGVTLAAASCAANRTMTVERLGTMDGKELELYVFGNGRMTVAVTNYGATVTRVGVPDRNGEQADVVLGFDTVEEYAEKSPYFGCIAGRVANRIAGGRFELDGETYQLATNNGPNHLHGGVRGFDKVVWEGHPLASKRGVELTYRSPDGEEGYPGDLEVTVTYTLTDDDELVVDMRATTDAPTIVNLAHHSYWNLGGHSSGDVLDHELKLMAERYTPTDATLIPTGELAPVAGTPYDFRRARPIGASIGELPPSGDDPGGFDMNYVVDGDPHETRLAAVVYHPPSGRCMEVHASEPGIQFYSGNFLDGIPGKDGAVYEKHAGFCLESQHHPDSINKEGREGWPTIVLRPGEEYRHRMVHRFYTR